MLVPGRLKGTAPTAWEAVRGEEAASGGLAERSKGKVRRFRKFPEALAGSTRERVAKAPRRTRPRR